MLEISNIAGIPHGAALRVIETNNIEAGAQRRLEIQKQNSKVLKAIKRQQSTSSFLNCLETFFWNFFDFSFFCFFESFSFEFIVSPSSRP